MCWASKETGEHIFNSVADRDAYDAKIRAEREAQAKRDAEQREARAFMKVIDEKVAKAKRNPQLIPVAAR